MAPGGEGLGWGVGVGGSDREVGQDLLDARGLLNGRGLIAEPESQCIARVPEAAMPYAPIPTCLTSQVLLVRPNLAGRREDLTYR